MRGLNSKEHFALFFDWFYPDYFSHIVEGSLNAFFENDDVVIVILKFLTELVYSRNNRLRFDTWTIYGLIVFKETAKYLTQLLKIYDCLRTKQVKVKQQGGDLYQDKMKYLSMILQAFRNMITGNYINFAICDYYQDDIFSVLSQMVMTSTVCAVDYESELKTFTKLHVFAFETVTLFF